jgi:hypothetical protein
VPGEGCELCEHAACKAGRATVRRARMRFTHPQPPPARPHEARCTGNPSSVPCACHPSARLATRRPPWGGSAGSGQNPLHRHPPPPESSRHEPAASCPCPCHAAGLARCSPGSAIAPAVRPRQSRSPDPAQLAARLAGDLPVRWPGRRGLRAVGRVDHFPAPGPGSVLRDRAVRHRARRRAGADPPEWPAARRRGAVAQPAPPHRLGRPAADAGGPGALPGRRRRPAGSGRGRPAGGQQLRRRGPARPVLVDDAGGPACRRPSSVGQRRQRHRSLAPCGPCHGRGPRAAPAHGAAARRARGPRNRPYHVAPAAGLADGAAPAGRAVPGRRLRRAPLCRRRCAAQAPRAHPAGRLRGRLARHPRRAGLCLARLCGAGLALLLAGHLGPRRSRPGRAAGAAAGVCRHPDRAAAAGARLAGRPARGRRHAHRRRRHQQGGGVRAAGRGAHAVDPCHRRPGAHRRRVGRLGRGHDGRAGLQLRLAGPAAALRALPRHGRGVCQVRHRRPGAPARAAGCGPCGPPGAC